MKDFSHMNRFLKYYLSIILPLSSLVSCSIIERSSIHGFEDGYYQLRLKDRSEEVYLDISDERVSVYPVQEGHVIQDDIMNIPGLSSDSSCYPVRFSRKTLDIDITSVLLKYRPNKHLPSELSADLNLALYAGPRFDKYSVKSITDPLGNGRYKVSARGGDLGLLIGIGTTPIGPFSTQNAVADEYSAMFLQIGLASFLETTFVSFGLAVGYDYLLTSDHDKWIYHNRPWIGFIIGIAIN